MTEDPVGPRNPNGERRYILHRSALAASLADATGAASAGSTPEPQENFVQQQNPAHLAMAAAAAAAAELPRAAAPSVAPAPSSVPVAAAPLASPGPDRVAPEVSAESRRRSSLARLNVGPMTASAPPAVAPQTTPAPQTAAAPQAASTSTLTASAPVQTVGPSEVAAAAPAGVPAPPPEAPTFPAAAPALRAWRPSDDDILPHRAAARGGFRMRRRLAKRG